MFNIRSVDLNLLPVFEAVYEERNMSRAAGRLAMTQSSVSHAVTRLRVVFRNDLFVRRANGVAPTPTADRLYTKIRAALALAREAVNEQRGFEPGTSERRFVVSIAHPLGPMIALRLNERLARIAPKVEIVASTRSRPVELAQALREGRVDAAVDWLEPPGDGFKSVALFDDSLVVVARAGHPALRQRASLGVLRRARFVSLRPRVEGEHPVLAIREWQQLNFKVALEVSEILEIFMVASRSDLFGVIPRSMLRLAQKMFALRALRGTPTMASAPIKLVWNANRDTDPAHAFLRRELAEVARAIALRG